MKEHEGAWYSLRCFLATVLLTTALSIYPKTSLRRIKLEQFIKDNIGKILKKEWGLES